MRRGASRAAGALALLLALQAPAHAAEGSKKGDTASYSALPTLTASIRRGDESRGVLSIQAGLDVPDPKLRVLATKSVPRLRDAYVRVLGLYGAGLTPGAPPNLDQIGMLLQRATDQVLGRPGAHLLLGTVLVN